MAEKAKDVKWLDGEEQTTWRSYLQGSIVLTAYLDRVLEEAAGLSLGEYEVLSYLSEAPEHAMRMSELAREVMYSRSRLTYTVRRMESAGLLERLRYPHDGRGVICRLTEKGYDVLKKVAPAHVDSVRRGLVDVLPPEQFQQLGEAMKLVMAAAATEED
jgi:DNA-binding MarR family transcriptional regulator